MSTLKDYAEAETRKIQELREKRIDGQVPFMKIPEGTTVLNFVDEEPTDSQYKDKKNMAVYDKSGEKKILTINTKSPLYREVMAHLAKGVTKLEIMRMGTTKEDTKYRVKSAE